MWLFESEVVLDRDVYEKSCSLYYDVRRCDAMRYYEKLQVSSSSKCRTQPVLKATPARRRRLLWPRFTPSFPQAA